MEQLNIVGTDLSRERTERSALDLELRKLSREVRDIHFFRSQFSFSTVFLHNNFLAVFSFPVVRCQNRSAKIEKTLT